MNMDKNKASKKYLCVSGKVIKNGGINAEYC